MRQIILGTAAAIAALTGAATLSAQRVTTDTEVAAPAAAAPEASAPAPDASAPAPVIIQANPTGPGMPTATPPDPQAASEPVAPALPADPSYQAGPYKGALTAPPANAIAKTYPVCTRTRQDSCRNPGGV